MKINDDYLWDRSGEPDPEIQQLEEILGTLRYQPRPLDIPAGLEVGRERSLFRNFAAPLAIAATIATLLLGLGLWLGLQRLQQNRPHEVVKTSDTPQRTSNPAAATSQNGKPDSLQTSSPERAPKRVIEPSRQRVSTSVIARNPVSDRYVAVKRQQLTAKQRQEAEAAKNQLMLALRVTSEKLSLAQKKTQTSNTPDQIHNQHKIG